MLTVISRLVGFTVIMGLSAIGGYTVYQKVSQWKDGFDKHQGN